MPGPQPYSAQERAEAERLIRETDVSYYEIADRTGVAYATVCRWNRLAGWRPVTLRASKKRGLAPSLDAVRRGARQPDVLTDALAMHAAREIAALDLALRRRKGETDSIRLLRDLVALAKVLDDLHARMERKRDKPARHGVADAGEADAGLPDVATLRADLARRIEAALAERGDPGGSASALGAGPAPAAGRLAPSRPP